MNKLKVLVADDHPIILDSIVNLLKQEENIEVVDRVTNGLEVLEVMEAQPIDLLIMDLNMPKMNGLECMEVIHKQYPSLKVIFLTIYQEEYVIRRLLKLGASGFLLKNTSLDNIIAAIERVMITGKYYDHIEEFIKPKKLNEEEDVLTHREIEIIKLLTKGYSSNEVADTLFISELTVQTHRKNILKKLNLTNTPQLVAFAKSSGIIE
ncbi:two-component system response regulator DegU [Fulvivirga kasyanovii]|uniref:response regulator transcription factor n=1 Tax=Fulvivirga kasyanovii TaxID=396812 RepID=UPI0031DA56BB